MNNETILRAFMQKVWNEKAFDSIVEFVNDEYTIHLDTGDPWEGKVLNLANFAIRLNYSFHSFPDINFDIQTAVADGDHVAITWIMTGTNLGNIGGITATSKAIKTLGATIHHFKNGRVSGHGQVFDRNKVMKQLGFK